MPSDLLRTTKEAFSASSALRLSATVCLAYLPAVGVETRGSDETRESNASTARPKVVRPDEVVHHSIQGEVEASLVRGERGGGRARARGSNRSHGPCRWGPPLYKVDLDVMATRMSYSKVPRA